MNNETMFSSKNQAWATRWEAFFSIQDISGKEYNLDPCAEVKTELHLLKGKTSKGKKHED